MQEVLFVYEISPTTWVYLSALMLIGIFFKFYRVWSLRNLDILALIAFAPGLQLIHYAMVHGTIRFIRLGFVWIAMVGIFYLVRLLLDPLLIRRPMVEPNLNRSGITFTGLALLLVMIASLFLPVPIARMEHLLSDNQLPSLEAPGLRAFHFLSSFVNQAPDNSQPSLSTPNDNAEVSLGMRGTKKMTSGISSSNIATDITTSSDVAEIPNAIPNVGLSTTIVQEVTYQNEESEESKNLVGDTIDSQQKNSREKETPHELNAEDKNKTYPAEDVRIESLLPATLEHDPNRPSAISSFKEDDSSGNFAKSASDKTIPIPIIDEESDSEPEIVSSKTGLRLYDPKTEWKYPSLFTQLVWSRTLTILGQLLLITGILLVGGWHFGNLSTGVAAATLYLLLPYSSQMVGRLDHVIPGGMIVCALALYRFPWLAGSAIGVAAGLVFYPFFLVPLWLMFYLRRGLWRFIGGYTTGWLAIMLVGLFCSSEMSFSETLLQMLGSPIFGKQDAFGLWMFYDTTYRIPIFSLYLVCMGCLMLWPPRKNFGVLLSGTTLLMLGCQFWMVQEGGLFMAWYLPSLILTVFRPNLEDRVATATVTAYAQFHRKY